MRGYGQSVLRRVLSSQLSPLRRYQRLHGCNPGAHAARQKHRQPVTARADPACCQRFSSQRLVLFEQITRIGETRRQAEPRPVVVVSFFLRRASARLRERG